MMYVINILIKNLTKYLWVIFYMRLTWAKHTKYKRKQSNTRLNHLHPLFLSSLMNLTKNILIHKTIIITFWTNLIQIWGKSKSSKTKPIQAFQSICLTQITGAPWYRINKALHTNLQILSVNNVAICHHKKNSFQNLFKQKSTNLWYVINPYS